MKIGITERGDAALDLSWANKMDSVDGAVIISKGFNEKFDNALLQYKDKIIYHATITGLGGTRLEPNVFHMSFSIEHLKALIEKGFPVSHIVVRIDPIVHFQIFSQLKGYNCKSSPFAQIDDYNSAIEKIIVNSVGLGIRRFRYSYLDLYEHAKKRMNEAGIRTDINKFSHFQHQRIQTLFYNLEHEVTYLDEGKGNRWNRELACHYDDPLSIDKSLITIHFESCAEENVPEHHRIGCVSKRDLEILGLELDEDCGKSNQRRLCLCLGCKTELLENRHPCGHKCLYCYWKD